MSGNQIGYIKGKLNIRGKAKPGDLIKRMNAMENGAKCKTCGMSKSSHASVAHKFDPMGMVRNVESTVGGAIRSGVNAVGNVGRLAGNLSRAFVNNISGGDVRSILKNKKYGKKSRRSV